jgi:glycosyltransferase involved in cell wall biosynthesis
MELINKDILRSKTLPVSVVILTRNSGRTLEACLKSVKENNPKEIIIIDGGSTDKTLEIAKNYTNKIFHDHGKGICYARQLGAEMASEEYVMYVDSDVILPPDTIKHMLLELRSNRFVAICARQIIIEEAYNKSNPFVNKNLNLKHVEERKFIDTRSTIYKRDLILLYKFDSNMLHCDALDISYKLVKNGYKMGLSSAHVYHIFHPNKRGAYWCGVALAEFLLKYRRSLYAIIRYVLTGLFHPFYQIFSFIVKNPRLIPYSAYDGFIQITGFLTALKGKNLRR